jgi:hypothetical protein
MDEENPTYAGLIKKWFWLSIITQVAMASKRLNNAMQLQKKV